MGRPLCIHSATTAICMPRSCLIWATFTQTASLATFVILCFDCFEQAQNFMANMEHMAGSEWLVFHLWTTKAATQPPLSPPTATWPVLWLHKGGTNVAYDDSFKDLSVILYCIFHISVRVRPVELKQRGKVWLMVACPFWTLVSLVSCTEVTHNCQV